MMLASPTTLSHTPTSEPRTDNTNWRSWKAERRGAIFCAPACGAGCTKKAHDAAQRKAKALAKRLGREWKPHVWENLGWHYSVELADRRLQVHEQQHGRSLTYTAFFNPEADAGGGKWAATAKTPEAAIRKVMQDAQQIVALYTEGIDKVREAMASKPSKGRKRPGTSKRAKHSAKPTRRNTAK